MKRIKGSIKNILALLIIVLITPVGLIQAQLFCDISIDTPTPVCSDAYFELSVFENPNQTFEWQVYNGITYTKVGNGPVFGTSITDSSTYRVIVIDTISLDTCQSELFGIGVRPEIIIEFDQLQFTCTNDDIVNGNSAKVRATALGEFEPDEYHYFWDVPPLNISPFDSTLAVGLKAHQFYDITVKDSYGCAKTEVFWTEAYENPLVEITADPDPIYIQNPNVTFSFSNLSIDSTPITNHFWWFSDKFPDPNYENTSNLLSPTYTYSSVGQYYVILTVFNSQGCDTAFTKHLDVMPSMHTNENQKISIKTYPNPVKDKLHIELQEGNYTFKAIKLYNSTGHLVYRVNISNTTDKFFEIPVIQHSTGLYDLHLSTEEGVLRKKILIAR